MNKIKLTNSQVREVIREEITQLLNLNNQYLLLEGGLGGHMNHLYDNRTLSFGKMKEIINAAASGKLQVAEKTDGQNLFISYSIPEGKAKSARNKGNIKTGGMDASQLASKFSGRGGLYDAFTDAFAAFERVVKRMPPELQKQIFGENADIFYNAEVMDIRSANVINYDKKSLVIHREGHAKFDRTTGEIEDIDVSENAATLERALSEYSNQDDAYRVMMKAIKPIKAISDGKVLNTTITRLNEFMQNNNLNDDNTVQDYVDSNLASQLESLNDNMQTKLDGTDIQLLIKKINGEKGIKIVDVLKKLDADSKEKVKNFYENAEDLLKKIIFPLEDIIHDFAVEVLRGMESSFVYDNAKEVQRLRAEVGNVVTQLSNSGSPEEYDFLSKQLRKLKNIQNISTAVEGIVFQYDGNLYKLTGNFAPVNQLLGFFKYGRAEKLKENLLSEMELSEGGRTLYFIFGRMNPPTLGHAIMLQEGLNLAKKENADYKIYLSKTVNPKKNPLPYQVKLGFFKQMFPQYVQYLVEDESMKTAIDILKSLNGQYDKIVMLVGEDRVAEFQQLLSLYNGKEYNFKQILVQNTGERVSGRSATAMRNFVSNNDLQGFISAYKEAFPNMNEQLITNLFEAIKDGMNAKQIPKAKAAKPQPVSESFIDNVMNILVEMSSAAAGSVESAPAKLNLTNNQQGIKSNLQTLSGKELMSQIRQRLKSLEGNR
jgi:hypothetical protein